MLTVPDVLDAAGGGGGGAGRDGGSSRICTDRLTPPAEAVISISMSDETSPVVNVNVPVVEPPAIVIESGIRASRLVLVSVTTVPPPGAAALSVAVPRD